MSMSMSDNRQLINSQGPETTDNKHLPPTDKLDEQNKQRV
jgi:hypothetical protein